MLRRKTRRVDAGDDVLGQLIDREREMATRLDAARADAERLLSDARDYARHTEASCESKIEERITLLSNSYEQQLQSELQHIQSEAVAEARRFGEENPVRTRALVTLVLEEIGAATRTNAGAEG